MTKKAMEKSFRVLDVSRNDLEMAGFDASKVTDDVMKRLANDLAEGLIAHFFYDLRHISGKQLNIPLSNKEDANHFDFNE